MGKPLFRKKFSFVLASTLVFSVLFASIVYACSGLGQMRMVFHHDSMNGGMVERGPCSENKQEICKSVRHRMLSIQNSSLQAEVPVYGSTILQELSTDAPIPPDISLVSHPLLTTFHPLFKLSLIYSYLVLRI